MAEDLELYSLLEVLKMSTRQIYEEELSGISDSVYAMSSDVEKAIDKTLFAFQNMSVSLSNEIMKHDDRIDTMEYQIEERCISIVIKQQPLASDWRKISSYMRMIADMERIADHCSDIAIYIKLLAGLEKVQEPQHFTDMFRVMKKMVADTFRSFNEGDPGLAGSVIEMDDEVDVYFNQITSEIAGLMKQNPEHIRQYIDYLFISKYVERMADHAANIADWVYFIVNGQLKLKFTDRYRKESDT